MNRTIVGAGFAALLLAAVVLAQDAPQEGKLKKVDPENNTITITTAAGKDVTLKVEEGTRIMAPGFTPLPERLRNKDLKPGAKVMFKVEQKDGKPFLVGLLLGGKAAPVKQPPPKVDLTKLTPLTDMGAQDYQGYQGGLYPGGKNERPAAHEVAGLALAKKIEPLDAAGKPSADGKIVLLSAGMSNTSQVFTVFKKIADADSEKNPRLVIVNGAQGGMTAFIIQKVDGGFRYKDGKKVNYWGEVDNRLEQAGVTRAQVQAVWIKQADAGPNQGFPKYAQTLQAELARIVQLLHERFPNVKLVYLSSRTYGGYATTRLNPEPYAFESGFSVKWLIEQQLKGDPELNYDPAKGVVKAPWLSWGPYLWARGTTKRADGFYYDQSDFGPDGTHPNSAGQMKVARQLLQFFKSDTTTRPWFMAKQ